MNFLKKWYTYQKERFPIIIFGLYIFCIAFAVFCFSNKCYGILNSQPKIILNIEYKIDWIKIIPMFCVAFLHFLIVRITDEFKDYEDDCKYRPYRPVPRGLISLKELKILFIICLILQTIITFIFNKSGVLLLVFVWFVTLLLYKDFFIEKIIDKHILLGVLLDELLMPVLVLYLASYIIPVNLLLDAFIFANFGDILFVSYLVSWIVEFARKVRCKSDEEKGVKTYTAVFGINKAIIILIILETLLIIYQIKIVGITYLLIILYVFINVINLLFIKKQTKSLSKLVELFANIYIISIYLSMALLII